MNGNLGYLFERILNWNVAGDFSMDVNFYLISGLCFEKLKSKTQHNMKLRTVCLVHCTMYNGPSVFTNGLL
jgi:hypothetical protein